jgi:signal recognition particle subunit SRP54
MQVAAINCFIFSNFAQIISNSFDLKISDLISYQISISVMFESLQNSLDKAVKLLRGEGKITDVNVARTVKEIRRALVDADVNYKVAKQVTDDILAQSMGQDILIAVKPGELFTKIVYDELTKLMGSTAAAVNLSGTPAIILMSGLQGSGKTTFSGKLANMYKKQGKTVMLAACDVYRPAAINQLQVLGERIGVEVYAELENKNPVEIAKNAVKEAKAKGKKVLIIDTAGRLAVDEQMMQEIAAVKEAISPSETLFVVDAMTGQDAVNTAKAFNEKINFDGVVLTKLDGDTRGGAALSIRAEVNKPIKFIGTGEKMEAIDIFHPDRMAQRILGFGDVISLVERAQQAFDQKEAEALNKRLKKNQIDFNDLLKQIQMVKKMGGVKEVVSLIPGLSKATQEAQIEDDAFKHLEAIILSMTPKERKNPDLLNPSRKARIAKGSGTTLQDVNALIKQYQDMKKMVKMMNSKGMSKQLMGMFK